jgi:CheY-like chemotaxis protein
VLSHRDSLSVLRHELRTPLNAIIGYSEMLLEDAGGQLAAVVPDLEKIRAAGKDLLGLTNEALDFERIKAEEPNFDPETLGAQLDFKLRTSLNSIIGYSQMLLEDAASSELEDIVPDLEKIHRAAEQFLALITDVARTAAGAVGQGPSGIEQEVIMPEEAMPGSPPTQYELPAATNEPCLVLVVDDNEMNRDILLQHLEQQGHAVVEAVNGREALEMVHKRSFDLVLLDIMMPEMDGYEVLQHLKSRDAWRDIPVIMISAVDELDSVVRCIEMGAEDYLPKPFNPVLLRARASACLEKKRVRDREVEYLRQVTCVTDAAAAIEADTFEPESLTTVAACSDALGQLARVFLRMAQEVHARERRLRHQVQELKIELDEAKQARQVAEITDTEYFQRLEARAEDLRKIIDVARSGNQETEYERR